jgi:hypothetical protein
MVGVMAKEAGAKIKTMTGIGTYDEKETGETT